MAHAPTPLLSTRAPPRVSPCGSNELTPGQRVLTTVGGVVAALRLAVGADNSAHPHERDGAGAGAPADATDTPVVTGAYALHALPDALPGVKEKTRHAWLVVLARHIAAALRVQTASSPTAGTDVERTAIVQARRLEQHVYADTRRGTGEALARTALAPTVADRQATERDVYTRTCRDLATALQVNGPYLLATYGADVTVLPHLDAAALAVGTPAADRRARQEAATALVQRVFAEGAEDDRAHPIETFLRCHFCGSQDLDVDTKQTRGCDEPATQFTKCNTCRRTRRE